MFFLVFLVAEPGDKVDSYLRYVAATTGKGPVRSARWPVNKDSVIVEQQLNLINH